MWCGTRTWRYLTTVLLATVTIGMIGTAQASSPAALGRSAAGSGGTAQGPLSLTVAPSPDGRLQVSVCDPDGGYASDSSWCTMGSLWTVYFVPTCVAITGRTLVAGAWVSHGGYPRRWWSIKVVDGGVGRDTVGISKTAQVPEGPCGSAQTSTHPLQFGDFTVA